MILGTYLHFGGTSQAKAREETSWGPEAIHPFAYANSSFFRSRMAGSSPAVSSEELFVLERIGKVSWEQALCLLLNHYLRVPGCLPQCPKFP